jgi:hypothetical protein
MVYIYGANVTPRIDAPQPLEQPAPLRTIGPIRAVTTPLGSGVVGPFFIGADTGCANAVLRVTGGVHLGGAEAVLGVGICPPNQVEGNAWINNELVVGTDPTGTQKLRVGGSVKASGMLLQGAGSTLLRMVMTSGTVGLYISPFADTDQALRISNAADNATRHDFRGDGTALLSQGAGLTIIGSGSVPVLDTTNGLSIRSGSAIPLAIRTSNWAAVWDHDSADREFRIDNTTDNVRFHHGTAATVSTADLALSGGGLSAYLAPAAGGRLTLGTASLPWGSFFGNGNATIDGVIVVGSSSGGEVLSLKPGSSADHTYIGFYADSAASSTRFAYIGYGGGGTEQLDIWQQRNAVMRFATNNTGRWDITGSGHLLAVTDNSFDIGASGANRPRDVFIARDLVVGGGLTADIKLRHVNVTAVGTGANTTETDLMSHTLPTLATGDVVEVLISGTVTGTNDTKIIRFYVGGTILTSIGTIAAGTTGVWEARIRFTKDSTTTHYVSIQSPVTLAANNTDAAAQIRASHSVAVDPSGAVIKTTGTTTNSGDEVTQEQFQVNILKA